MCNDPGAGGSMICHTSKEVGKDQRAREHNTGLTVIEAPDHVVPFRSYQGFLPYPKTNGKPVEGCKQG